MGVLHLNGSPLLFGGVALHFAAAEAATLIENAILIRKRSTLEMAPESVLFEPDVSTLTTPLGIAAPTGSEIHDNRLLKPSFVWTFGDSYSYTSTTNTATATSGSSTSPVAQHVYRAAGTYNVRLDIYYGSGHWYSTRSVTVGTWSGTTITVGPSGRDHTTFASALSAALGTESGATEIVLDRGETFSFSGQWLGDTSGNLHNNLLIRAATGAGADPIVNVTGGWSVKGGASAVTDGTLTLFFQNITWQGPYDSTAGTGQSQFAFFECIQSTKTPGQIVFDGGKVQGFWTGSDAVRGGGQTFTAHLILNDTNWNDYGGSMVYGFDLSAMIATGSFVGSHVDARINNGAAEYNAGFAWRGDSPLVIHQDSDMFCRQGWSGTTTSYLAYQGLRLCADGREDNEIYVSGGWYEGGFTILTTAAHQDQVRCAKAVVIDGAQFCGNWQTTEIISIAQGGVVVKNVLGVWPDTPYENASPGPIVSCIASTNAVSNAAPVKIYNTTGINHRTTASNGTHFHNTTYGSFSDLEVVNNIFHETGLGTPVVPDAPLYAAGPVLMTPREKGYRDTDGTWDANIANMVAPSNTMQSYAPMITGGPSAAIGDATSGTVALLDRTRTLRGSSPSRGWQEEV